MPAEPNLIERSLRRSSVRSRLLLVAARRGLMHAHHLALVAGIDTRRLKWAMNGHLPRRGPTKYRRDRGLVRLGLFIEIRREDRVLFRLTPQGRTWARRLAKRRSARLWL